MFWRKVRRFMVRGVGCRVRRAWCAREWRRAAWVESFSSRAAGSAARSSWALTTSSQVTSLSGVASDAAEDADACGVRELLAHLQRLAGAERGEVLRCARSGTCRPLGRHISSPCHRDVDSFGCGRKRSGPCLSVPKMRSPLSLQVPACWRQKMVPEPAFDRTHSKRRNDRRYGRIAPRRAAAGRRRTRRAPAWRPGMPRAFCPPCESPARRDDLPKAKCNRASCGAGIRGRSTLACALSPTASCRGRRHRRTARRRFRPRGCASTVRARRWQSGNKSRRADRGLSFCPAMAASRKRRTPAGSVAQGFSQKVCLLASTHFCRCSGRNPGGVQSSTMSTSGKAQILSIASRPTNLWLSSTATFRRGWSGDFAGRCRADRKTHRPRDELDVRVCAQRLACRSGATAAATNERDFESLRHLRAAQDRGGTAEQGAADGGRGRLADEGASGEGCFVCVEHREGRLRVVKARRLTSAFRV